MSEGLSRRNFLKGAALTGAALAGSAALAGCASGGSGSGSAAAADWMPASWDYETDVVVVGYGGAGMWASLIAADEGGSEVVVLEKAPVEGGGNSRINNGEWTVIKDPKLFREYCVAFGHGLIEEDMIDAYIAEATQHTDYADKYGMTYEVRRAGSGRHHPRVLVPGRRQVCRLHRRVKRRGLRHDDVPRA